MQTEFWTGLIFGIFFCSLGFSAILYGRWRRYSLKNNLQYHTENNKAENSLQQQSNSAQKTHVSDAILESLPIPIFLINAQSRVLRNNAAAITLIGKSLENRNLSAGFRNPEFLKTVTHCLETHKASELNLTLSVPIERSFLIKIEPVSTVSFQSEKQVYENIQEALIMMSDITPIIQTEKFRTDFVANVSHELRTPLASLIGFIETLRGPARHDPSAQEKFLQIMQEQADRMFRLISDLLSLSHIEMTEHTIPRAPINVVNLVKNAIDTLDFKARDLKTYITFEVINERNQNSKAQNKDNYATKILGDSDQLTQVFQNLIDNALKYGGRDKKIDITAEYQDDFFWIAIRDFGPGIPREKIPRLTERFYRVDTARSHEMGGTGLGLAIVKHIINRHRGRFIITSEEGKGSIFKVGLPINTP